MTKFSVESNIFVTTEKSKIISTEFAVVEIGQGTIWAHILENEQSVGIIFLGPSQYAIEAIVESKQGVIGECRKEKLDGPQVLFGPVALQKSSRTAIRDDLLDKGFRDSQDFIIQAKERLPDAHFELSAAIRKGRGRMLIGRDENQTNFMLIVSQDVMVFQQDDKTIVFGDEGLIILKGGRITIVTPDGLPLIIKNKIPFLASYMSSFQDIPFCKSFLRFYRPFFRPFYRHFRFARRLPWHNWY